MRYSIIIPLACLALAGCVVSTPAPTPVSTTYVTPPATATYVQPAGTTTVIRTP
jgi:hypothetical protein